jgi:hypothetical protein
LKAVKQKKITVEDAMSQIKNIIPADGARRPALSNQPSQCVRGDSRAC